MNKRFITLQILGIILASFSQLFCVEQEVLDPQPNCRAATSHVPVVSAVEFSDAALQRAAAPLSQGMGAGAEVTVISTAAAFCNWVLSAGKDAAMSISQWMSGNDKADVLNAIAAAGVPDGLLTDTFVEAVNRLFQGRGGFDETRMIRALASMPVERLTPEFVAAVNRLSQEIMVCKEYVIRALAGVPVERLTPAFVEAASCLSQEMGVYDQVTVIKALAGVPAERLEVFAAAMNRLSSGMGGGGKSNVIKAVASIPAERLTPAFEAAVNRLSNGMGGKTNVISALASMPAERLTSAFEAAVNRLSNGMGGGGKTNVISAKSFVIGTLASMPAERLTPAFEAAVNRLSQGIDEYSKTYVIRDLASIPAERLEVFEAAVNRLSNGMSGDAKAKVIGVLAGVPVGRLTPEFVAVVNAMTQGMAMNAKVCVIFSSASLSADRLTPAFAAVVNRIIQGMDGDTAPLILNEFFKETNLNIIFAINQGITDAQMNGIRQFVPAIQRVDLFHRLSNLATPAERATEINRVIELYRHVYVAGAHLGAGKADIHRYSGAAVVNKVTNKKQQLNEAVIERLEARLSNTNTASYNAAIAAVSALVGANSTVNQVWAQAAIRAGGDDTDAKKAFYLVYTFLAHDKEKLNRWLAAYLDESLNARGVDTRSCVKGMRERVITSLRGIDPELDAIFNQAEGSALAAIFLRSLNLNDQKMAKDAANILYEHSITAKSTSEQAAIAWKTYVEEELNGHHLSKEELAASVESMGYAMASYFDERVKPILRLKENQAAASSSSAGVSSASSSSASAAAQAAGASAVPARLSEKRTARTRPADADAEHAKKRQKKYRSHF